MAETDVSAKDRERYARARARGEARAQDPSAVVDARYDPDRDLIALTFGGGGSMAIPRNAVPGLHRASTSAMESIVVSPAGDALSWPSLDVERVRSGPGRARVRQSSVRGGDGAPRRAQEIESQGGCGKGQWRQGRPSAQAPIGIAVVACRAEWSCGVAGDVSVDRSLEGDVTRGRRFSCLHSYQGRVGSL